MIIPLDIITNYTYDNDNERIICNMISSSPLFNKDLELKFIPKNISAVARVEGI